MDTAPRAGREVRRRAIASPRGSPVGRRPGSRPGYRSAAPPTVSAPPGSPHHHARHDPYAAHGDRLGAGVAELVDELVHGVARERAVHRDLYAGPRHAKGAGPGEDVAEVAAHLQDEDVSPRRTASGERLLLGARRLVTSSRSWLFRAVTLATSSVRSWTERAESPWSCACERSWATTRKPSRASTDPGPAGPCPCRSAPPEGGERQRACAVGAGP